MADLKGEIRELVERQVIWQVTGSGARDGVYVDARTAEAKLREAEVETSTTLEMKPGTRRVNKGQLVQFLGGDPFTSVGRGGRG